MLQKKDIKTFAIIVVILLIYFGLYFFAKQFVVNPTILNNEIEDKIPLIPVFILFYMAWYFLLVIVPFILSRKSDKYFKIYCVSYVLCWIIAFFFYVFLPTAVKVPIIESNDVFSFLCNVIYPNDMQRNSVENIGYAVAANVFPNGHTIASMLFIYCTAFCKQVKKSTTIIIACLSIGIIASTIFIKQHVFVDLLGGFIIATIVFFAVKYFFDKKCYHR